MTTKDQWKKATIETIASGATKELFEHELENILRNIEDVNTPAKKKRKLKIEYTFVPTEDRDHVAVELNVTSSIPGVRPVTGSFFLTREDGKAVAYVNNPKQEVFHFEPPKAVATPESDKGAGNA